MSRDADKDTDQRKDGAQKEPTPPHRFGPVGHFVRLGVDNSRIVPRTLLVRRDVGVLIGNCQSRKLRSIKLSSCSHFFKDRMRKDTALLSPLIDHQKISGPIFAAILSDYEVLRDANFSFLVSRENVRESEVRVGPDPDNEGTDTKDQRSRCLRVSLFLRIDGIDDP